MKYSPSIFSTNLVVLLKAKLIAILTIFVVLQSLLSACSNNTDISTTPSITSTPSEQSASSKEQLTGVVTKDNANAKYNSNAVVLENQKIGTTDWIYSIRGYKTSSDTFGEIKGYASLTSVNKGETIKFNVTVNPVQNYNIEIYRMGWYGAKGGRLMQKAESLTGIHQPVCPIDNLTGAMECDWTPGYSMKIPEDWTSGVYLALLTNQQNFANYIIFVVRDDQKPADFLYQQPVADYEAYNTYPHDGIHKNCYVENSVGANTLTKTPRAVKVSFDRPYDAEGSGQFLLWEDYFVQWIEKSGYNVTYSTDIDTNVDGKRLLKFKGILSVGHAEYWSKQMYDAVQSARDAGVNLAFFGANDVYWQIRFEPSTKGEANRLMDCYKDVKLDPVKGDLATVQWRDPLLKRPEQSLLGIQYGYWNDSKVENYAPLVINNSSHWFYSGTGFQDGDKVNGIVGYEVDYFDPQAKPPVAIDNTRILLSSSPFKTHDGKIVTANSSIYQAPSHSWVFASGTIAWSWGLINFGGRSLANNGIQRATTNLLNKFLTSSD